MQGRCVICDLSCHHEGIWPVELVTLKKCLEGGISGSAFFLLCFYYLFDCVTLIFVCYCCVILVNVGSFLTFNNCMFSLNFGLCTGNG